MTRGKLGVCPSPVESTLTVTPCSQCDDMEVVIDSETRPHAMHDTAQQQRESVTSMSLETPPREYSHSPSQSDGDASTFWSRARIAGRVNDQQSLQDHSEVMSMIKRQRAVQRSDQKV